MTPEHFTCTNCGRITPEGEVHQLTYQGKCLAARVSWFKSDSGTLQPAVEKVGEFGAQPSTMPRAGGL